MTRKANSKSQWQADEWVINTDKRASSTIKNHFGIYTLRFSVPKSYYSAKKNYKVLVIHTASVSVPPSACLRHLPRFLVQVDCLVTRELAVVHLVAGVARADETSVG
jgi:hypothetical protein